MKKRCAILLTLILLLTSNSALAVKARSINSDADSDYHFEHLLKHIGESICHATGNYIKTRTTADSNKVIGHLEQADEFILLDLQNGRAQIEVIYSDKTSPDSWVGMKGWVTSDYIDCTCNVLEYFNDGVLYTEVLESNATWKQAYRQYILENDMCFDENAEFWFVYVNNDLIPELVIDTRVVAGGCHVLTYNNDKVNSILIGSTGTPYYLEKDNLLLDSAGHQGYYYDTVYTIENGEWVQIYHAEKMELYEKAGSTEKLVRSYYVNDCKVTSEEYSAKLREFFDPSKATALTVGTSYVYLEEYLN